VLESPQSRVFFGAVNWRRLGVIGKHAFRRDGEDCKSPQEDPVCRLFAVGRGVGRRGRVVKDSWPWAEMGVAKTSTRTRTTSRERAYGLAA